MKAWSIKQLAAKLNDDLAQCQNDLERSMVRAIGGREIRETAQRWAQERKLTPGEVAIAELYGYRA